MVELLDQQGEPPTVTRREGEDGTVTLILSGDWTLRRLSHDAQRLSRELEDYARDPTIHWDLEGISALDSVGAFVFWQASHGQRPQYLQVRPEHLALFRRWSERQVPAEAAEAEPPKPIGERLTHWGLAVYDHVTGFITLIGQVFLDLITLLRQPWRIPFLDISATVYQSGVRALGITALVGFLIGIVLSYLSSVQLRTFGAQAFIVNILGISIIRELGPLLAAILVAGRSGSAMAAQLGVMRLTQELDALTAMGVSQSIRLILPKLLALTVVLPLLVLWTDILALIGGMLSAKAALGISIVRFVDRLPHVVPIANLWIGLSKAAVFGMVIALVACHFGLRIKPNTESLGVETTNAVVSAITLVILVDAIFAVAVRGIGVS
ncbi:MlaE family ABC transporter permease [Mangrovitalea sediminis]|uniref:MlaE family ABC transporter permease n=1 Tax=Mangrovitalea sediminis TaxID=1982043 RepID=UPI000BE59519|nr:ABC transporter permease [Mangrovitalea sediminis]